MLSSVRVASLLLWYSLIEPTPCVPKRSPSRKHYHDFGLAGRDALHAPLSASQGGVVAIFAWVRELLPRQASGYTGCRSNQRLTRKTSRRLGRPFRQLFEKNTQQKHRSSSEHNITQRCLPVSRRSPLSRGRTDLACPRHQVLLSHHSLIHSGLICRSRLICNKVGRMRKLKSPHLQ